MEVSEAQATANRWRAQVHRLERQVREGHAYRQAIDDLADLQQKARLHPSINYGPAIAVVKFRQALFAPLGP